MGRNGTVNATPEAHAHGQRLFPAGAAALEGFIQIVGDPGQKTDVLQDSKKRKEDRHRRQHDGDDPCQYTVKSQNQKAVQPGGGVEPEKEAGQAVLDIEQSVRQKGRRIVCAADRDPEDHCQQQKHQRKAGDPAGKKAVYLKIGPAVRRIFQGDDAPAEPLRRGDDGTDDSVLPLSGIRILPQELFFCQSETAQKFRIPEKIFSQTAG